MGKLYLGTEAITPFVYDNQGGGGTDIGVPREISQSGVYQIPSNLTTYSLPAGVISLGDFALAYACTGCTSITSVDFSNLVSIDGTQACDQTFQSCPNIVSVDLSALQTIKGASAARSTFSGCTSLSTIEFTSLSDINSSNVFSSTFRNCSGLTSVSFPALTSSSFGDYTNQFNSMLYGCSNVTLHFPSGLASTIPTLTGYPGFGGSGTRIVYDL